MMHIVKTYDGENYLYQQFKLNAGSDIKLTFGPLNCMLASLLDQGFGLRYAFSKRQAYHNASASIYLVNPSDTKRWALGKIKILEAMNTDDLAELVTRSRDLTNSESNVPQQADDPWDILMKKYPKPKLKMVGNQTIEEYVSSHIS